MNAEKLKRMQEQVRTGGPGSARRKKKVKSKAPAVDDRKIQQSLKKIGMNPIPGIEEVTMFKDDGSVVHFTNPTVQASLTANTFSVDGKAEHKQIQDMLPGILNQLGQSNLASLGKLASAATESKPDEEDDDDVPDLVENFDEASKDD